jgi:glycosyltransferase involved in cell wall biosynthesis
MGALSTDNGRPKFKVVRIIARLNVGGAARQACMLHEKQAQDFETRLVAGTLAAGEQDMSYLLSSQANVIRLPDMSREISIVGDLAALWKLVRLLRKERPHIVHTHTAKAGTLGRLAAWLTGVPIIVHTYHGHVFTGYFSPLKTRIYLSIERLMGRLSTKIIAVSKLQQQDLCFRYRVASPDKVREINNGFDLEVFQAGDVAEARKKLGLTEEQITVVWAGRMEPVKGLDLLAEVIRIAHRSHRQFCFLVIGDGKERRAFEANIAGCDNVRMPGWIENMAEVWSAADAALLTSHNEGTPTVLIEAMAAGLPFVSTSVGGVPDLAVPPLRSLPADAGFEAGNGFITARKAEAILYCLERIACERETGQRMGKVGAKFALETFSAERLVKEMTLLYMNLLAASGRYELADISRQQKEAT